MPRQPYSKTKIIGGKLVTVYDHDPVKYSNVHSRMQGSQQFITRHDMASVMNPLNNTRLEAERNKARALSQTYRSVLSPEPLDYMDQKATTYEVPAYLSHSRTYVPIDNLNTHVLDAIGYFSRYKLLTILSAMRRRDPHETGVLFKIDVEDVLDINNVSFKDENVLESLCSKYEVSPNAVDYRRMWKFVMDCYANKDKADFAKSKKYCTSPQLHRNTTHSNYYQSSQQSHTERINSSECCDKTKKSFDISPGFKAELEFELRHYARVNQGCVDLKFLEDRLETMDPYRTGKLLHKEVSRICQDHLKTLNLDILNAGISACDVDKSGLVDYNLFLQLLRDVQPTYLPPIVDIPQGLSNQLQSRQRMKESQSPIHQAKSDQLQTSNHNHFTVNRLSDLNNNKTTYTNTKLEEIGALGLHLSDFETEIFSRKSAQSVPQKLERPSTYHKDHCDNVNTYMLLKQPPPSVTDKDNICSNLEKVNKKTSGMSISSEGHNSNCEPVSRNSITLSPSSSITSVKSTVVSPKSPRMPSSKVASSKLRVKKPNRKQWHKTNESSSIDSNMDNPNFSFPLNENTFICDNGLSKEDKNVAQSPSIEKWWKNETDSGNVTPTDDHKTWCQSSHIQTIKGKRRRKKKVIKREQAGKTISNDLAGSNTESDKTDMDSAFYTTTDYEVDDRSFEFNTKNILKHSSSYVLDGQESKKCPLEVNVNGDIKFNESVISGEEKCENIEPAVDEEVMKKEKSCEDEEKLHLECVSPTSESSTESRHIEVNGKLFTVYPSVSNVSLEKTNRQDKKLCLEYIYGHGGSTIHCVSTGELVFHAGNIVVVMDSEKLKQRFFKKHNAMVTCITIHQDHVTIASTQRKTDKKCIVYVWNCIDLSVASTIFVSSQDVLYISAMDFSKDSVNTSLLATIQNYNDYQIIAVYDWKNSSLKYKIKTSNVSGLLFSNVDKSSFVTYGKLGHVMFYKIVDATLSGTRGDFGDLPVAKNIGCTILNKSGNLITGDTNGTIHIWTNELYRIDHCIHNAHRGPISSMVFDTQGYLLTSCGKDQTVISWDSQMKVSDSISLPEAYIGSKAMCVHKNKLFVASLSNVLAKVTLNEGGNPLKDAKDNIVPLCEGNPDITTDMAVHPSYKEMIVTLCADGTVQMYNADSKNVVWVMNVRGNGSCVTFHPCQEFIAIGCQDGSVHLISSTTGDFVDKFKDSHVSVSSLQFSPGGKHLACGFHNGQLVIYTFDGDNKELEFWSSDQLFQNKIEAIDWTISGTVVRVQSSNVELMFYNTSSKDSIENNKELLWSSNNCSISYETLGAWKVEDPFAGNMVFDTSPANNLLVFTSRGLLYMVNYPWTKQDAPYMSTPSGFEGANSLLCCAVDGGKLFVAFDIGSCVWQWSIS